MLVCEHALNDETAKARKWLRFLIYAMCEECFDKAKTTTIKLYPTEVKWMRKRKGGEKSK